MTQTRRQSQQEQGQEPQRNGPPAGWRYYAQAKHRTRFRGWIAQVWRGVKNNAALVSLVGVLLTLLVTTVLTQLEWARQQKLEEQRAEDARTIAEQQAQQESLQTYLGDMDELMLRDTAPLTEASPEDVVSRVAQAKTRTVLLGLDPQRKTILLQFLVEARLVQGVGDRGPIISLAGADLSSADLFGAYLRGADLLSADLSNADLSGVYLSNANLSNADLRSVNLRDADLRGADLSNAVLFAANPSDASLNLRADLSGADLSDADLSGADLSGANLDSADLSDADLSGADLRGAHLAWSFLRETDLKGANLQGANLSGDVDLSDANLEGANLEGANLEGANLEGAGGVTDQQLAAARSLEGATMPDGTKHP